MNRDEFRDLIDEERFTPFMITTKQGFTVAIGPNERKHVLAGAMNLVLMESNGHFIHIPYHAIDRIHQLQ
jgi:hypothetical protein